MVVDTYGLKVRWRRRRLLTASTPYQPHIPHTRLLDLELLLSSQRPLPQVTDVKNPEADVAAMMAGN